MTSRPTADVLWWFTFVIRGLEVARAAGVDVHRSGRPGHAGGPKRSNVDTRSP